VTLTQWLALLIVAPTLAVAIFAFRQGFKVKPDRSGAPPDEPTWWR
jgi:hypothetical protein